MDIHAWLQDTELRRPPDERSSPATEASRECWVDSRTHDLKAFLAQQGLKRRRSTSPLFISDVRQEPRRRRKASDQLLDQSRTRAARPCDTSSPERSRASLKPVIVPYQRRPRRKTREDRYDPKPLKQRVVSNAPVVRREQRAPRVVRKGEEKHHGRILGEDGKRLTVRLGHIFASNRLILLTAQTRC